MECERGLVALAYGLLCETSERSLSFAEFSDRAPLTKPYPSLKNFPPHVRESKTVLDSGFRAVDFGFKVLDSRFFVSGIPDSLSCIPDSKAQDSGFLKQKFPGFGSQEFRTWGEKAAVTKLINCTFFSPIQEPSFLFT